MNNKQRPNPRPNPPLHVRINCPPAKYHGRIGTVSYISIRLDTSEDEGGIETGAPLDAIQWLTVPEAYEAAQPGAIRRGSIVRLRAGSNPALVEWLGEENGVEVVLVRWDSTGQLSLLARERFALTTRE